MKISVISPNLSGCVSILDTGVTYLATYINERTSHDASIWDYTFNRHRWREYLVEKYKKDQPDVIGITHTTLYTSYVVETIKEIRENISKDIPIVLGGYHPTLRPRESINLPGVDAVICGEGEYILSNYMDALESKSELYNIPGLLFKLSNGSYFENARAGWIEDISSLPFPDYELWEDVDKYLYFIQQLWLIGSRGCPYPCTNCEEVYIKDASPGNRFRYRDPQNYVDEIKFQTERYKDRGMRMGHPFDPVFPINAKWTREFCSKYIEAGMNTKMPLSIFARGDTFYLHEGPGSARYQTFDHDRIKCLAEAGVREVRIGVETGTDRMRNDIHKKQCTTKQLEETFHYMHKYDINTIAYNMLGGPTETRAEMMETFKLNWKLRPNKPIFFIYQQLAHDTQLSQVGNYDLSPDAISEDIFNSEESNRSDEDQSTIQFGEPMESKTFSKHFVVYFQLFCYFFFVGKRVSKMVYKQRLRFFTNLYKYMRRGQKEGANMKIVFAYFLGSCEDNLFE
ncbi:MAG: B12-binding domain-containing radical SAM protein [Nitrospina sp.]|nr:B12-binding domain-containing radical SAM protein [Nitrospina sp.]